MSPQEFTVTPEQAGQTIAAVLRRALSRLSWSQVRRLIAARQVLVGGEPCLDDARRLREGEIIQLLDRPISRPRPPDTIPIRYVDEHIVVVEKPAGISTVRHPLERDWSERRKRLSPTLEDQVRLGIAAREHKTSPPRLRIVHRLDKETSGLLVFARTPAAERALGRQFRRHTVHRRYLAIIPGQVPSRRVATRLVRDRGDGRRGSTSLPGAGKEAVTHMQTVEPLGDYSLVTCRLETGRTHQIRIHLAELGHPICGEKVYNRPRGGEPTPDPSHAPRLALHAAELGFDHPITGAHLHFEMALPADLQQFRDRLRGRSKTK